MSVKLLAEQLEEDERVDTVVVLSFDGESIEIVNGVSVHRIAKISPLVTEYQNVRAYRYLRRYVGEFDLIHAYNMELHPVVGAVTSNTPTASVGTLNSYHFFPKSVTNTSPSTTRRIYEMISIPTSNRILQYFLKKIDQLIALSTAVRSVYVEQGYDSTHIEVIPNMVDPSFSVTGSNIIQSQNSERKILYVGELSEKKGVDHLIRAISRLPDTYHLTVVGDGAQREYLEELIVDLGIRDQVTFKGQVSYKRIPQQYSLADVFVHPGVWPEPFGRTVLEAMQASLPVVCTRIGGPADLIQESELQVPPANTKALSMAIEQAYRQRDEIGEQNRRYVASKFTPDAIINQILSLYKNLC